MSICRFLVLVALIFTVSPAMAGEASYADMRGRWQTTKCTPPQTVAPSDLGSEAAADDLNSQVMQHNQFVAEARAYMNCLANEANTDAQAMSYLVTETVKMLIDEVQQKINQSSLHIKQKQEEDKSFF